MDKKDSFIKRACLAIKNFFIKIGNLLNKFEDVFFPFLKKHLWIIIMIAAFGIAFWAKATAFSYASADYNSFLKNWMNSYKELGLVKGFGTSLGDYTPLYNYLLCIFAQFVPESGYLIVIKGIDIVFELSLSIAFFFIVYTLTKNKNYSAIAFAVSCIIPSIIINGALWGQCDVIFTSFIVWSFYFILIKKYHWAMIFFSISFAIKLQAVFFLPLIAILMLKREIKIWTIIYVPLIYLLIAIPALACGRPFMDVIGVYFKQGAEYKTRIALSAPSIYALFDNNMTSTIAPITVPVFLVITMTYVFYIYHKDIKLNASNLVTLALVSVLFSPYFLPYMHERYFFLADIFTFLYIFIKKKGFVIAALINMASIVCCCYWLLSSLGGSNMFTHFNPIRVGTLFNLIAIILLIYQMMKLDLNEPSIEEQKEE